MTWSPRSKNAWHFGKNVPLLCSDSPTANAPSPPWIWANHQTSILPTCRRWWLKRMRVLPLVVKSKLILDKSKVSTNWHVLLHVLTGAGAHGLRKLWSKVGTSEAVMRCHLKCMMGKSKVRQHILRHKKPRGGWGSEPTAPSCSVDGKPGEMYSLQTDVKEMCGPRAWMDTLAGLQSIHSGDLHVIQFGQHSSSWVKPTSYQQQVHLVGG